MADDNHAGLHWLRMQASAALPILSLPLNHLRLPKSMRALWLPCDVETIMAERKLLVLALLSAFLPSAAMAHAVGRAATRRSPRAAQSR